MGKDIQAKCLIVLTRDQLQHRYIVNHISKYFDIAAVIIENSSRTEYLRAILRQGPINWVSRLLRRILLLILRDEQMRDRVFMRVFGESCQSFYNHDRIHRVENVNNSASIELIKSLQPDILLVYGTRKISASVLSLAAEIALNLHTGISPYYRGTHCAFWPIVNCDWKHLGSTVHECTGMIDAGTIFKAVPVTVEKGDSIHDIFARCVVTGATAYSDVLRQYLHGTLTGKPQKLELGSEYRASMRGTFAELKARWNLWRYSRKILEDKAVDPF